MTSASSDLSSSAVSSLPFFTQLAGRCTAIDSLLCIGLDPHPQDVMAYASKIKNTNAATTNTSKVATTNAKATDNPADMALQFCLSLVEKTLPYAACYKPNAAFFEALGEAGHISLKLLIAAIQAKGVPVLLDIKRGDIGSTATAYAKAAYGDMGADAVTLSPLMGWDSVAPFVTDAFSNKGAFLLCKTSNPGSNDLLALDLAGKHCTLYEHIARLVGNEWNAKIGNDNDSNNLGLVVGATDAVALAKARQAAGPKVWILAPGVGAQGGDLLAAAEAGLDPTTGQGLLIPVSRGVSRAEDPAKAAEELRDSIRQVVKDVMAKEKERQSTNASVDALQAYQKEFIEFALDQGVLKFGSFVLKSGRTSPYFFNAGLFCSGQALHKLGHAYASAIMDSPDL